MNNENIIQKEKKIFECKDCYKNFNDFVFKCNSCKKDICENCYKTGLIYGQKYRSKSNFSMCDQCCWWEIS